MQAAVVLGRSFQAFVAFAPQRLVLNDLDTISYKKSHPFLLALHILGQA